VASVTGLQLKRRGSLINRDKVRLAMMTIRRNNLLEDAEFLAKNGLTIEQIADRLRLTPKNVQVTLRRYGSEDLLRRLSRNKEHR
jgi:DNA-binding NarL/FixJ family response regulator